MLKNITYFGLLISALFFTGCEQTSICNQVCTLPKGALTDILKDKKKNQLAHNIYKIGQCDCIHIIPELIPYIHDQRISTDSRHKGMSINYITNITLNNLSKKNIHLPNKASNKEIQAAYLLWLDVARKNRKGGGDK